MLVTLRSQRVKGKWFLGRIDPSTLIKCSKLLLRNTQSRPQKTAIYGCKIFAWLIYDVCMHVEITVPLKVGRSLRELHCTVSFVL